MHKGEVGLNRLLKEGVFEAAYPLHDGDTASYTKSANETTNSPEDFSEAGWKNIDTLKEEPREELRRTWAKYSMWYKHQPIEKIRDYFGEKIGFYFAWLGAYTTWLVVPSVVGVLVFIYGLASASVDVNVKEV